MFRRVCSGKKTPIMSGVESLLIAVQISLDWTAIGLTSEASNDEEFRNTIS